MKRLRVMIADDHQVVREGLREVLELEEDIEVVGDAGDGREAVQKALALRPDVILMDVMMPEMSGIDACQEIREQLPETAVLMLTASGEAESVTASLVAGANGYLLKVSGRDELVRGIRSVGEGHSILDPLVTTAVTAGFSRLVSQELEREVEQLTPREHEVLLLVAQGATNREIGDRLVIAQYTARNTVSNILGKLGLRNRSELVRWAMEHNVLEEDPGTL